jgi:hypothetical protein
MITCVVVATLAGGVYTTELPVVALSVPNAEPTNDQFKVEVAGAVTLDMVVDSVVVLVGNNVLPADDAIGATTIAGDTVTVVEADPVLGEVCTLVAVTTTVQRLAGLLTTVNKPELLIVAVPAAQVPPVADQVTPGVVKLDT